MIRVKTQKPNRCKHCKVRMPEELARHVLHPECVDAWWAIQREKQERARVKVAKVRAAKDRRETKEKLETFKKIPELIAAAQKEFNTFIRLRDQHQPCICCGCTANDKDLLTGSRWDAGHYRSTGSASHLRFNEDNCHRQLVHCNRHRAGRAVDYRLGLIARIGLVRVEALESSNEVHKWTREELIEIKATYAAKVRALKAKTE